MQLFLGDGNLLLIFDHFGTHTIEPVFEPDGAKWRITSLLWTRIMFRGPSNPCLHAWNLDMVHVIDNDDGAAAVANDDDDNEDDEGWWRWRLTWLYEYDDTIYWTINRYTINYQGHIYGALGHGPLYPKKNQFWTLVIAKIVCVSTIAATENLPSSHGILNTAQTII